MSTAREIFETMLRTDGAPERQLVQYEPLALIFNDPINGYLHGARRRGTTTVDRWGTTILFPEDAPGSMPHITKENKVCPDITHWRDYVHAPDLTTHCTDGWEDCLAVAAKVDRKERLLTAFMATGIFEQCHFLMGFEDTLTNLYEHPDEMHELIDYITEYRLAYVKLLIDHLQPDALLSHDDWGTKNALFMKPEMWRAFFKEPYRKFYGYVRSQGVIAIHHADSYLSPIVEDMAEIGIQAWQGVLPENDIPELQQRLNGRLILIGGVGAAIDRADAQENEIRAYVRRTLDEDCPGGHFIPCITYGTPGTVYPHVDPIINSEIESYNAVLHLPRTAMPAVRRVRQTMPAAKTVSAETSGEQTVVQKISTAMQKGQKKKVLQLCQQALDAGVHAEIILTDGLVAGMTALGEDFSASRVFVPEMLVAAQCMSAATALLKSHFAADGTASEGRVCLGTVRGDMHDIGKNLVKIMMEGSGLTVVDLGVDVSAETFVQTAKEQHCGVIACSALLTTTMPEMRRVVELVHQEHLPVHVMVGGAPITQEFCDDIGADGYTSDASLAARMAVRLAQD
jgi:methanogenic corrinoid protein MtbC1